MPQQCKQQILAVDDDPAVTSVLRRGLAYEGFEINVASSGERLAANYEAVKAAAV